MANIPTITVIPDIVVECSETQTKSAPVEEPPPKTKSNVRKKFAVLPGHSMTHWMQKISNEKKIPPNRRIISLEELKAHNKKDDMWMVLRGKVYDVTDYVPYHPGGVPYLMKGAGRDATKMFNAIHVFVNFENILQNRQVGIYIPEDPDGNTAVRKLEQAIKEVTVTKQDVSSSQPNFTPIVDVGLPSNSQKKTSEEIAQAEKLQLRLRTPHPEDWLVHVVSVRAINNGIELKFKNRNKKLVLKLETPPRTKSKREETIIITAASVCKLSVTGVCTKARCSHSDPSACDNFKRLSISQDWFPHLFQLYLQYLERQKTVMLPIQGI